jgi:hypothetical protein
MVIDFSPPAQSWSAYLDSLPPGAVPRPTDIFDRWDARWWICQKRPNNGTPAQRAAHVAQVSSPGACTCGAPLKPGPLMGLGEARAYRAWVAEIMEPEERDYFWVAVASARPDALMQLGVVPLLRKVLGFTREVSGEIEPQIGAIEGGGEVPNAR